MSRWCRVGEAARLLGVSRSTVRRMVERGHLRTRAPIDPTDRSWLLLERADVVRLTRLVRSGTEPTDPGILRV